MYKNRTHIEKGELSGCVAFSRKGRWDANCGIRSNTSVGDVHLEMFMMDRREPLVITNEVQ